MILADILQEMPYLHPGAMSREIVLDGSYSIDAIKREFSSKLGRVGNTDVLIDTHRVRVIGVPTQPKLTEVGRVLPDFVLLFKTAHLLKFPNTLHNVIQVDRVATHPVKSESGVATGVYKLLVDSGYTLVSDITQYETAQGLWKKLARDRSYKVYVADVDHGMFRDTSGTPIVYDGVNILDDDIWSHGSNYDGQYRVLILTM
jgi:hypothetical protein